MRRSFVLFFVIFCLTIFVSPVQADPARGLQGYWAFKGNANDSTGNYNDLTVSGATLTSDRYGYENRAYTFDGSDDYLYINDTSQNKLDITGDFTITVWIKFNSLYHGNFFYSHYQNNTSFTDIYLNSDNYRLNFSSQYGGTWEISAYINWYPVVDTWYHLTFVGKGGGNGSESDWKIYINGIDQGTLTKEAGSWNPTLANRDGAFYFGKQGNSTNFLNGQLDEIRFYNRILSNAEIYALAHSADCDEDGDVDLDDLSSKRQEVNNWVDDFISDMD